MSRRQSADESHEMAAGGALTRSPVSGQPRITFDPVVALWLAVREELDDDASQA